MYCQICGKEIDNGSAFCKYCGAPTGSYYNEAKIQTSYNNSATQHKSKWIALLLCLCGFFLIGGLHRFYADKNGTAVLYLLTGGFFGIGTLIDTFIILTGNFTDRNGVKMI